MTDDDHRLTRRTAIKGVGAALGAGVALGSIAGAQEGCSPAAEGPATGAGSRGTPVPGRHTQELAARVSETPMVDSHEHLIEEHLRVEGRIECDDWTYLLGHYLVDDLRSAGMGDSDLQRLLSSGPGPRDKWSVIEPWCQFGTGIRTRGKGELPIYLRRPLLHDPQAKVLAGV